jgi:hypothetical protein
VVRLTEEEKKAVVRWLQTRAAGPRECAVCLQRNNWVVADDLVTSSSYQRGDEVGADRGSYPQAMLVCENCGNTVYLNAVMIGIVEGE